MKILLKKREVKYFSSADCVGQEALEEEKRGILHCVVSENMVGIKTKRKQSAWDGSALAVCSRTFSWLKNVEVAGVSLGMIGNMSGHSSEREELPVRADGCSHVGFVVLVFL